MRKQILKSRPATAATTAGELDVETIATVLVTSKLAGHSVENAFDGRRGPGSNRWISETGTEQTLVLAFDVPQTIRTVGLEIEETEESRTQELQLAVSRDGEKSLSQTVAPRVPFRAGRFHL